MRRQPSGGDRVGHPEPGEHAVSADDDRWGDELGQRRGAGVIRIAA